MDTATGIVGSGLVALDELGLTVSLWQANAIGAVIGAVLTVVVSFGVVGRLLDYLESSVVRSWRDGFPPPEGISTAIWMEVRTRVGLGGRLIGFFEGLIFFASFWTDGWPLLASWLAFKVASQWESWKHSGGIVQFAEKSGKDKDLLAIWRWISLRYMAFLTGTAANIVIALGGAAVGRAVVALCLRA